METILKILNEIKPEVDFNNEENLIEQGIFDSFDIIEIVSELEEAFDIKIDALDIIPENFLNFGAIGDLAKKSGANI